MPLHFALIFELQPYKKINLVKNWFCVKIAVFLYLVFTLPLETTPGSLKLNHYFENINFTFRTTESLSALHFFIPIVDFPAREFSNCLKGVEIVSFLLVLVHPIDIQGELHKINLAIHFELLVLVVHENMRYRKLKFRFRATQLPTLALRRFSSKHTNVYCRKIISLLMTSLCRLSSLLSIDHHHSMIRANNRADRLIEKSGFFRWTPQSCSIASRTRPHGFCESFHSKFNSFFLFITSEYSSISKYILNQCQTDRYTYKKSATTIRTTHKEPCITFS
ncbi:hypothetical protein AGLY_011435, partial [Aphis glycines]